MGRTVRYVSDRVTHDAPTAIERTIGYAPQRLAGLSLVLAAVVTLLGIITAEALFPTDFIASSNTISDLGANPLRGFSLEWSAIVFDSSMILTGFLVVSGAYLLYRAYRDWWLTVPLAAFGVGIAGVGIFPSDSGPVGVIHSAMASLAFLSGSLAAIASYRVEHRSFRYVSVFLGLVSLTALTVSPFTGAPPVQWLGDGGIERWIVYPITIWMAAFAGYMLDT